MSIEEVIRLALNPPESSSPLRALQELVGVLQTDGFEGVMKLLLPNRSAENAIISIYWANAIQIARNNQA